MLMNLPPLPGQETCETESPRHTRVLTALVATPSGIPQKPLAFPVHPWEAWPRVLGAALLGPRLTRGGGPQRPLRGRWEHTHTAKPAKGRNRRGVWGRDSPSPSSPGVVRDATGSSGRGCILAPGPETSPHTYKACLGKGHPMTRFCISH